MSGVLNLVLAGLGAIISTQAAQLGALTTESGTVLRSVCGQKVTKVTTSD